MHVIYWNELAIKDLISIGTHIASGSPANAAKLIHLIEGKVKPLADYPFRGHEGRKSGTRELLVHKHYVVVYRVLKEKVEILRVKHTAQQWP